MSVMRALLILVWILILISGAAGMDDLPDEQEYNLSTLMNIGERSSLLTRFDQGHFDKYSQEELAPVFPSLLSALGSGLAHRGEYHLAADLLSMIPEGQADTDDLILLAFVYTRTGEYDAALRVIRDLRIRYPNDLKMDNAMAYILNLAGSQEDARRLQARVMAGLPGYAPAIDTWGTILMAQGFHADAAENFERALRMLPYDAEVTTHLAEVLYLQGDTVQAKDYYKKAVRLDPQLASAQKGYARVLMDLSRYAEAEPVIRSALLLLPGDPELALWEREADAVLLEWYTRQEEERSRKK